MGKKLSNMKKWFVIHPVLFAIFPVLYLFSYNIKEMLFSETIRPIIIVVSFTLLLWLLLALLIRNLHKAGVVASIFSLWFFSYGHLWTLAFGFFREMYLNLNENYFILCWVFTFAGSTFLVIRTRRNLKGLTHYLNLVSIFLIAIPVATIGVYKVALKDYTINKEKIRAVPSEGAKRYPDIYYIILDGYARADILEEFYQYDNSAFLKGLAQKGFYIGSRSSSNYAQTNLSLASSLNLTYLDDLAEQVGPEFEDRLPLRKMVWSSRVTEFLKEHGFIIVSFSSGLKGAEIESADVLVPSPIYLSEFENLLLSSTAIPVLLEELPEKMRWQHNLHRRRLLFVFDHLADAAKFEAPVFVFAHILAPHPPFVFGKNGEKVEFDKNFSYTDGAKYMGEGQYADKYRNQLIFINKKIEAAVDEIIVKSAHPPIIILQADHGPGSMLEWANLENTNLKERLSIFNAYYLPEGGGEKLYPEITPVNTFRVIFNHYFGADLELLEDKCYFSTWRNPYKFIDVTDIVNAE
jgi:hypothetical protein